MKDINSEYYFAFRPDDDAIPILQADAGARGRKYRYSKMEMGAPLVFKNGFRDVFFSSGMREKINEIMHDAPYFIFGKRLKDELSRFDTNFLQLYPSIYIDNDDRYHEGYWFTNFYGSYDLIDYSKSVYDVVDGEQPGDEEYIFEKIRLSCSGFDGVHESNRLLVHERTLGYVLFHERLVDFILREAISGANFFRVCDFVEGDQYS